MHTKTSRLRRFAFAGATLLGLLASGAPLARAQFTNGTISVDFNAGGGVPATEEAGPNAVFTPGQWNEIDGSNDSGSGLALVTSTGAASGVTLAFNADADYNALNTMSTLQKNNSPNLGLLQDYIIDEGNGTSFATLSGLAPGATYNLAFYNASDTDGRATTFIINALSETATYKENDNTFVKGDNYVEFDGVAPATNGTLTVTFDSPAEFEEADFDGFQIEAVPEPSTWAGIAVGAGLLGLTLRRRLIQRA